MTMPLHDETVWADERLLAARLAMARDARVAEHERVQRSTTRLASLLACMAALLAVYDVAILSGTVPHV